MSPTLFTIAINDIIKTIENNTKMYIFAEDVVIYHRGANQATSEEKLQQPINNIEKWAQTSRDFLSEKQKLKECISL